jgi:hypothetical protein
MLERVSADKYLGIHTRCMGLYLNRFSSKRMNEEQWQTLFANWVELWFGQLILNTAIQFISDAKQCTAFDSAEVAQKLSKLFNKPLPTPAGDLNSFSVSLQDLQRSLDDAVNQASFRRTITPEFIASPGSLTFGIPKVLRENVPCLKDVQFTLFIDEYEHLYAEQQRNINTLIRERESPVSFKIGARLHGMKTYQTWGGDEELKQGSDYELLLLDATLRKPDAKFEEFALQLCLARIKFERAGWPEGWDDENAEKRLIETFEAASPFEVMVNAAILEKHQERPWMKNLGEALNKHLSVLGKHGVADANSIEQILSLIEFAEDPLIEKTSTFLFYCAWADQQDLNRAAEQIQQSAVRYGKDKSKDTLHAKKLKHFRTDMKDQMLSELKLDKNSNQHGLMISYIGLTTWIRMSDGIIRNLITTLKHVYDWALFRGESVYSNSGISLLSQVRAVQEACQWFIDDANVLEADRGMVETGVKRVANLMSKLRFSEKPPECSLCRFSVNMNALDAKAKRILEAAEKWSLLIRDPDRKQRNPGEYLTLMRINPLVAPDYYLPIAARGNIDLSAEDCLGIFGSIEEDRFRRIEREKVSRCTPPFSRRNHSATDTGNELNLF